MVNTVYFDIKDGVLSSVKLLAKANEIIIPKEVKIIGEFGLNITSKTNDFNKSVEKIYIPSSITKCNINIFKGFVNIKEIILENPSKCFKLIGKNLFSKDGKILFLCSKETFGDYEIQSNTQIISAYAFENCNKIKTLKCPESIKSYEEYCFANMSKLENIELSSSSDFDGFNEGNFFNCLSLNKIVIPKNISIIPNNFARNCKSLEKVVFQDDKINYIGKNAFDKCESLIKLELPDSLHCIEDNAFKDCKELVELTIKASKLKIENNPFIGCNKLCLFSPAGGSIEKLSIKYNLRFYNL